MMTILSRVVRQGLYRGNHRNPVQEVSSIPAPASMPADVLPIRRIVLRHHDRHQPHVQATAGQRATSWYRRPSGWRARPSLPTSSFRPAPTSSAGTSANGQLARLRHPFTACNHRIITLQHKAIEPLGESKSDYEIFPWYRRPPGLSKHVHRWAATNWTGSRPRSTPPTRSHHLGRLREEGLLRGAAAPGRPQVHPGHALVRRGPGARHPRLGSGSLGGRADKGLQTQSGKIEFVSNSLKRAAASGLVDPERPSWARSTSPAGKATAPPDSPASTRCS